MGEIGLLFYRDALTLTELACNRVALMVWRNEIINYELKEEIPSSDHAVYKFNTKFTNSSIPPLLRRMINKCISRIGEELKMWMDCTYRHFNSRTTVLSNRDTWIKYFDELAWSGDDFSIDGAATCLNLLRSDQFNREEKFAMACLHCLEDHIKDLWAKDLYQSDVQPWVLRYWNDRMKNQICGENISNAFDPNEMSESMPLNRRIIDHFWPYTDSNWRITALISLMWTKDRFCIRYILPKLSAADLQGILPEFGSDLLKILIQNEKCRPLAVPFWNHARNSFDAYQFLEAMAWMLQGILPKYNNRPRRMSEDEISLSLQIWTSAPQELKEYVIWNYTIEFDSYNSLLIAKIAITTRELYRDLRLLKMVLFEASPEQRDGLWRSSWQCYCLHAKKSDMKELIELCLPDAEERDEFKRQNMMNFELIKDYCFSLLHHMEFDKFNDFLEICSADPDGGVELRRNVLKSCLSEIYVVRDKLDFERDPRPWYIDTERTANAKKEFLSSVEYSERLVLLLQDGHFSAIKNAVTGCLRKEEDELEWKVQFTPRCRHCLTTLSFRQFNQSQWQDFMMWCLGNEEKVAEFKRSLNLDEVLGLFLRRRRTKSLPKGFHEIFDEFLNWCLDSEGVAALKRRYVERNPDNGEIRGMLFGKKRRC